MRSHTWQSQGAHWREQQLVTGKSKPDGQLPEWLKALYVLSVMPRRVPASRHLASIDTSSINTTGTLLICPARLVVVKQSSETCRPLNTSWLPATLQPLHSTAERHTPPAPLLCPLPAQGTPLLGGCHVLSPWTAGKGTGSRSAYHTRGGKTQRGYNQQQSVVDSVRACSRPVHVHTGGKGSQPARWIRRAHLMTSSFA